MSWVWWTVIGIFAAAIVLFFVSCAWLNHFLDVEEDDDKRGGWY